MTTRGDRAVVLGASLAGVLAARALADAYGSVTVVDRDPVDARVGSDTRRGVPQGAHAHGLLAGGRLAIEELFPGATDELRAHGAVTGDVLGNAQFCLNGRRLSQAPLGLTGIGVGRPLLESYLRSRLAALDNVELIGGCDLVGLEASDDRRRVTGVRVQDSAGGSATRTLPADLVVDATGRGSRTPRWLAELGYDRPEELRVTVDLGYATRQVRTAPGVLGDNLAIIVAPTRARPRGGVSSGWRTAARS